MGSPLGCEDDGPAGPGEAKWQSCSWQYEFAGDGNLEEDFLAYWVQMEIDPGKGSCAKSMSFKISDLSGLRIVSAVPRRSSRSAKGRLTTTEFVVDADGDAAVPGTIAQDVLLGAGRTTVSRNKDSYSYRWNGNSRDKVVVAIGIELAGASLPPGLLGGSWSEGVGAAMGSCRTPGIGVGGGR